MGVGSACEGGPCTGHLLLKTELYQAGGFPGELSAQCGACGTHIRVPGAETCPAVGLGALEVFAEQTHTCQQGRLGTGFHLEQFYAGLNSASVGDWGNSRKWGDIFWLLHLRGTLPLAFLFSWMIFFKIMGFFSPSLCNG